MTADVLGQLVDRSRSIGADTSLVVHGGGNTSAKGHAADHLGRVREVLWVKGTGADMASSGPGDYPGLWLDELRALRDLDEMTDERMTEHLRIAQVDPGARRASIETLLHAFVPYPHVDHVHADSIVTLTKAPDAPAVVAAALGDRVGYLPWIRPGFALGKLVAGMATLDGVVLGHHGLVTWADDTEGCLTRTRALVERADAYLSEVLGAPVASAAAGGPEADALDGEQLEELLLRLRGAVCTRARKVLRVDRRLRPIADRPDVADVAAAGVATADHMMRMRPWAAVIERADVPAQAVEAFQTRYEQFFRRHESDVAPGFSMHDPAPAAMLVPGVGAVAAGRDERQCTVVADVLLHTAAVGARARDAFGSVDAMDEGDVFAFDYWPMELYKLTLAPSPPELAGHVVCVTGAASGIGRAVAVRLARAGAHLVVGDLDGEGLGLVADEVERSGSARPECTVGDVSEDAVVDAMVSAGVRRFGGIDGVVVNAGVATQASLADLATDEWRRTIDANLTSAMLLTRAALRAMRTQGLGGSIVYVASKNAFGPGSGFGAYSVSKAGMVQLMRVAAIEGGPLGVRANAVNPDAVFEGSRLWSEELRRERAAVHGVAPGELEAFYAGRNLLGSRVGPSDVANAVEFLLSGRSVSTTGAVLPVDGGVVGAFPR